MENPCCSCKLTRRLAGRSYHKQWPCCGGEALNDGFPGRDGTRVFDMDFGRVAVMTCVREKEREGEQEGGREEAQRRQQRGGRGGGTGGGRSRGRGQGRGAEKEREEGRQPGHA